MKSIAFATLLTIAPTFAGGPQHPNLIPRPNEMQVQGGHYLLKAPVLIDPTSSPASEAKQLQQLLPKSLQASVLKKRANAQIRLRKDTSLRNKVGKEGYQLTINRSGITITAPTATGLFYGGQTLLQLINQSDSKGLPHLTITDTPRFAWRGLMLDEARHFMGKKYVKHLLRTMAAHKMNRFHWHLTDDQGWRIEIKKYPKLTSIGAWRGPGTNAPVPKWDKDTPIAEQKYGGFYTQEDIKEIVAYAKSLHIEILPEIDVPGHAMAIALSYPEVLPKQDGDTGKGVHGLKGNVLSVVREQNYTMLNDIFREIAALFPFPYLHIGGDEVNVNAWKASPEHRAYMKKHGMKNPHQLQNMFMLHLEKLLKGHGKTLMGWNEIMHGGKLSNDTGVMAWISIGAGLNAARHGYPTVMAVGPHNYFDMKYPGPGETGHWWAGIVDTKRAYSWNPLFEDQLKPEQQKNVLGVHCALWTEFVPDPAKADYQLWPRACATAEVGWTQQKHRDWHHFSHRLGHHLNFLDALKVGYRVKPPKGVLSQGKIILYRPYYGPNKILFTLDGTEPLPGKAKIYSRESIDAANIAKLRYRTLRPDGRMSKVVKGAIREPIGHWDPKILAKGKTTIKLDITNTLNRAGNWILECRYKKGKNGIHIHSARILEKGKPIASAKGQTVHGKQRTARFRLPITHYYKGETYTLELTLEGDSGNNSHGDILLDCSVWIEPTTTVTTQVPAYGNNTATNAANWIRSDWFWSSRKGQKGDQWTYTFDTPITIRSLSIPSGKPNSNTDIIVDANIEVSTDGTSFHKAGNFAYGTGTVKFDKPTTLKAVRVTLGNDHSTWIILRDLEMKAGEKP